MRPKRLISLLVAVCMMITMLPLSAVTAFAEDTSSSTKYGTAIVDGYRYGYMVNADGKTVTIEGFSALDNSPFFYGDIPEKLDGYTVTAIGNDAFYYCLPLKEVTIPQSVTSIGERAFANCSNLNSLTIKDAATSIGAYAFIGCTSLTTLSLGKKITAIGNRAFYHCMELESVTIPENVTTIRPGTFDYCTHLESITLPAGLTSFQDNLTGCPADCVIYFNNDEATALDRFGSNTELAGHKLLCLLGHVTFDANGGTLTDKDGNLTNHAKVPVYKTEKITKDEVDKLTPTRPGYNFTGWYTTADGKPEDGKFDVDKTEITKDITLYAHWAPVYHPLTVTGGIVTVKNGDKDVTDTLTVTTDETTGKKTYSVPDGATVTVTLDKTLIPEGMVFDIWSTGKFSLPLGQDYKAESITFTMNTMSSDADIAAQYRDATIEDDGPNVLGTAAIIGTAAVGTAVLGYQAYSLGAEFAGKLMALPYFPSNRSALAMMLWEDAGKPMPESELLYPDVGQEERDMDLQHAARWAMENELIPDLNDEGTAPEEMKFFPANPVSKLDVLNAWQKAQELKNN